ncbi:MAG TPA: tetraacyldisaccharide 4'-kinase [Acetobacteraceae bacterium]
MMPPRFWTHDGVLPRLLSPLSALVARSTARRVARPGWRAPVPVLCCGNAGVGGAGKTTLALDLVRRLQARGVAVHCLTRGYGGRTRGVVRVDTAMHGAALVGDEPLLLAAAAPTWVSADRAAGARAAVAAGAGMLVMDDGLQNPGLVQDLALLVVDGASGFGNGRVLPAGPLREPVAAAAARCRAAVLVGPDVAGALAALPPDMPVLTARLKPDQPLQGRRVLAFAGIARPSKFFQMLHDAGAEVAAIVGFPDHHSFTAPELDGLLRRATALGAEPATTPKDAVRLSPGLRARVLVVGVSLAWDDPTGIEALLDTLQ